MGNVLEKAAKKAFESIAVAVQTGTAAISQSVRFVLTWQFHKL